MLRLQKYLAECGIASRRASEELIRQGSVTVNGETAQLGCSITPETDDIAVNGTRISPAEKVYVVLNKPTGVITTAKDTHGRKTVLECVQGTRERVFPVGRLDKDVEGVLFFTNDGDLAQRLLHPKYHIGKEYVVWVHGRMQPFAAAQLKKGVQLDDGITAPAQVTILGFGEKSCQIKLVIHEGRKREVKRMCAAVGHPVRSLRRTAFAGIRAHDLRPGEWRYLTADEVTRLRNTAAL